MFFDGRSGLAGIRSGAGGGVDVEVRDTIGVGTGIRFGELLLQLR